MGLRDIGASLPPGFRFYPSDEELVCHYLYKKITNEEVLKGTLVEIDLHICEPWQLPEVAKLNANEWYFFSFRDRKYATGFRTNRATTSGYWKATGKDRTVHDPITQEVVGMRKTLVFYRNRAPNGIKTGWIMHEFRLETPHMPPKEDWVLCRVFHKSKEADDNTTHHHHSSSTMHPAAAAAAAGGGYSRIITASSLSSNSSSSSMALSTHHHHHLNPNNNHSHHQNGYAVNLLHLTNASSSTVTQISDPKCGGDDGYGFIWDLDLQDRSFHDAVASNLEGIRFEVDINNNTTNNNNMVLL